MHAAALNAASSVGDESVGRADAAALRAIGLRICDEVGIAEVRPKSGNPSTACFQRIMP